MEKLYKLENGKYVEAGYGPADLTEGIWLIQNNPHSKSMTSMVWKVGELKRPVDILTHASIQSMADDICKYIIALNDVKTDEWKDAKAQLGGWLNDSIGLYNISPSDYATLILRRIAQHVERGEKMNWPKLIHEFRDHIAETSEDLAKELFNTNDDTRILWKFIDWLTERGYELKNLK